MLLNGHSASVGLVWTRGPAFLTSSQAVLAPLVPRVLDGKFTAAPLCPGLLHHAVAATDVGARGDTMCYLTTLRPEVQHEAPRAQAKVPQGCPSQSLRREAVLAFVQLPGAPHSPALGPSTFTAGLLLCWDCPLTPPERPPFSGPTWLVGATWTIRAVPPPQGPWPSAHL